MRTLLVIGASLLGLAALLWVAYGQRGTWSRPLWGVWRAAGPVTFVLALLLFILGLADGFIWFIPATLFLLAAPISDRGWSAAAAYRRWYFPKEDR